jgi:hypothetical protein
MALLIFKAGKSFALPSRQKTYACWSYPLTTISLHMINFIEISNKDRVFLEELLLKR